jgi:hypothetical protein
MNNSAQDQYRALMTASVSPAMGSPDRVSLAATGNGKAGDRRSTIEKRRPMGDGMQGKNAEVSGRVGDRDKDVAQRARSEASQVADTAKDRAHHVKDEAAAQARGLLDQAKTELRDKGRSQADQATQAIRRVGDQTDALAAGRPQDAGAVADYVRQAGDKARQVADRLEARGIDGVMNDVENVARRKPGAFLLGCVAAGFVAGRLIRSGAASSGASDGSPNGAGGPSGQSPMFEPPPVA